jgi:hypothetical protein
MLQPQKMTIRYDLARNKKKKKKKKKKKVDITGALTIEFDEMSSIQPLMGL